MKWHTTVGAGSKQAEALLVAQQVGFPQVVTQPELKRSEVLRRKL